MLLTILFVLHATTHGVQCDGPHETCDSDGLPNELVPEELRKKFQDAGQAQVFKFADEGKLTHDEVSSLVEQLKTIDLARVDLLYKEAMQFEKRTANHVGDLEPLDAYDSIIESSAQQRSSWESIGMEAIRSGQVAALVLAGGAGTRLGSSNPKGMYDIGLPSGKSLFQIFAERLLMVRHLASSTEVIPWYIMTSEGENHDQTVRFFRANNFFGYPEKDITFFTQGRLPCLTENGKIMLETGSKVGLAADGNGGVYSALKRTGKLADMALRGVKYIHCFAVDNAIAKVADPIFLGYSISQGAEVGNKVVWKNDPWEKVGVIGKRAGKNAVIDYSEIKTADAEKREPGSGKLVFGAGNICNHFFTLEFLNKVAESSLTFHVARKKIKQPSADGKTALRPTSNTGIKLECFVFDSFALATKMAVLEGPRDEEFSPVKNAPGNPKDSPDSARSMLSAQSKKWLRAVGVNVTGRSQCEIGPNVSYRGEGMETVKKHIGPTLVLNEDIYIDVRRPGGQDIVIKRKNVHH